MSFAKYYLRLLIRPLFNFYRWIIIRTDKKLFATLFNMKSILINSSARLSWDKESFIFTDNEFPSFNHRIRHQIQCNDTYEFGIKRRLDNLNTSYFLDKINFSDGDIFVDCGANVGDLKFWFDFNGIQVKYIGFEPSPVEFQCLYKNVSPSTAHNLALWNKNCEKKFYISSQGADSSLIEPKSYEEIIVINGVRLDSYINTKIKCLKLEAEGAEPEILQGLGEKIKLVEFITADLGFERGISCESTLVPVTNFLIKNNFQLIDLDHDRVSALFKNTL
jgi:FkbM family methyltransferase